MDSAFMALFALFSPFLLLLGMAAVNGAPQVVMIAANLLIPDPGQPRKVFHREKLEQLAESIKDRGMFNPIRVRYDPERQLYIVIAGERRLRAALLLGMEKIPCIVADTLSEADILADQLAENLVRADFLPIEVARGYERFMKLTRCTQSELAAKLHVSNGQVTRDLSLLLLPADLQDKVGSGMGMISPSIAYELVRFPDEATMRHWAELVMSGKATRAEVQRELHARIGKKAIAPKGTKVTLDLNGIRAVISNGEALTLEAVVQFLADALKRVKRAASLDDLKGG